MSSLVISFNLIHRGCYKFLTPMFYVPYYAGRARVVGSKTRWGGHRDLEVATMAKAAAKKVPNTKTVAYDVAEQLRTPQEMAAYLDAWLEEAPDDAAGIARALGDIARAKGMSQVAKDAGLSRESLYRALSADGNPSFATVLKVARVLGVKLNAAAV